MKLPSALHAVNQNCLLIEPHLHSYSSQTQNNRNNSRVYNAPKFMASSATDSGWILAKTQESLTSRVSHFSLFFLIELHPINHSCSWVVWVHKKDFSVIDQKLKFRERFSFLHFLQGKNAQNRPENQQNWNLAKIGPKSDKFTKSKP